MKITESKLRLIIRESIHEEQFKVPAAWLVPKILNDVAGAYKNQKTLPKTEQGGLIWDALHDAGIEKLDPSPEFEFDSSLHRWIVNYALQTMAELPSWWQLPPHPGGSNAIAAAKEWLINPCEQTRRAAVAAGEIAYQQSHYGEAAVASSIGYNDHAALYYASRGRTSQWQTRLRHLLVLAALDKIGILPAFIVQEN